MDYKNLQFSQEKTSNKIHVCASFRKGSHSASSFSMFQVKYLNIVPPTTPVDCVDVSNCLPGTFSCTDRGVLCGTMKISFKACLRCRVNPQMVNLKRDPCCHGYIAVNSSRRA